MAIPRPPDPRTPFDSPAWQQWFYEIYAGLQNVTTTVGGVLPITPPPVASYTGQLSLDGLSLSLNGQLLSLYITNNPGYLGVNGFPVFFNNQPLEFVPTDPNLGLDNQALSFNYMQLALAV